MTLKDATKNLCSAKQYASASIMILADEIQRMRGNINHDDGILSFGKLNLKRESTEVL